MNRNTSRTAALIFSLLFTIAAATPVLADDTEIFFNQSATATVQPNLLLILDTSGSMDDNVTTRDPFDAAGSYADSGCNSSYFYYSNTTAPPACGSTNRILKTSFKCLAATTVLQAANSPGSYTGTFIRWGKINNSGANGHWGWSSNMNINSAQLAECQPDAGIDGNGVSATALWPDKAQATVLGTTGNWVTTVGNSWWGVSGNAGGVYTFYSKKYMDYYYDPTTSSVQSKIKVMQTAISSILASVSGLNVGVMRYDYLANGGMVLQPITPIATSGPIITNLVNSWVAAGNTPLSETMYEAYKYYSGGTVGYGNGSFTTTCTSWVTNSDGSVHCNSGFAAPANSVASARNASGSNYDSPMDASCQKNYIVYLTDGLPTADTGATSAIRSLVGAAADSTCTSSNADGVCLASLAGYMHNNDLRSDVSAVQNVTSYFIGFGDDFVGASSGNFTYLQDAATAGGGQAYTATSYGELIQAFGNIFPAVLDTQASFTAPAVAVNAFNRTQTLNDLYVSVFKPTSTYHWPGNVKKYKVIGGAVVDSHLPPQPAVDPATGFFSATAQSYWSATVDGYDVPSGGAANNIPDPVPRKLYTYLGSNAPASPATLIDFLPANVPAANFALGAGDPTAPVLMDWARGVDVQDDNNDGSVTDTRHVMGDPVHAQPAVVIYGTGATDTVIYTPTNDGYLHAVDGVTGVENWAFIPKELLPDLKNLYGDDTISGKHYGIDGSVRVLKFDINGNGVIDTGGAVNDRVVLYFGTGRNSTISRYYAIDVTDKVNPKFMWSIDSTTLPGLGQAWAEPTLARINIAGVTQNSQKMVLVIGGGYDPAEDGFTYATSDSLGSRLFMVDAIYGTRLWYAGGTGSGANFINSRMTHAIPAPVPVFDMDGDGFADRIYIGDLAGQLWRFDIINGQSAASLVRGGAIASLGTKDSATHPASETRRFYAQPDVAAVANPSGSDYLNIAIASGYRGHPTDTGAQDRLYSVRDYLGFTVLTQAQYDTAALVANIVHDGTLQDITASAAAVVPVASPGWKYTLDQHGGWVGEKSIVPPRTFDGKIFYTTYTPNTSVAAGSDPCDTLGSGTNRVYVLSVGNGGQVLSTGRSLTLAQGGIAPETSFLFLPNSTGTTSVLTLNGVETLPITGLNARQRTYWRDSTAE